MPNNNHKPAKNPKLIHYNLFQKPWCYDNIQYSDYFWEYAKQSGYYDELLTFKENYSGKQKNSDSQCLEVLIKKADKLTTNEITFKNIENKYHNIRI